MFITLFAHLPRRQPEYKNIICIGPSVSPILASTASCWMSSLEALGGGIESSSCMSPLLDSCSILLRSDTAIFACSAWQVNEESKINTCTYCICSMLYIIHQRVCSCVSTMHTLNCSYYVYYISGLIVLTLNYMTLNTC